MSMIDNLRKLLDTGQDSPLLRYSLGTACQKAGDLAQAREHLAEAVRQDQGYSAAWKAYGKVLAELDLPDEAIAALEQGIRVAEEKGDIQASKEMKVFLKRAQKRKSALDG